MAAFSVILAAAGQSRRFNDPLVKKTFALLQNRPVWFYSARQFRFRLDVKQLLVVLAPDDLKFFENQFRSEIAELQIQFVAGGNERSDSVRNGLNCVDESCDFVAIHDAARPCIDAELIERVFTEAEKTGAAIPAIAVHSTVKKSLDGKIILETLDRNQLYLAQTPQVFQKDLIINAFRDYRGGPVTDESQLLEQLGYPVSMVDGSPFNLKITTNSDLALAASYLDQMPGLRFDANTDSSRKWC